MIARLRARLVLQVAPPMAVSAQGSQHQFDEDTAAYNEIEVREGELFAVVIVRGDLSSDEFIVRLWHRFADEVWLVDHWEQAITIVPRTGVIRVFEAGETLRSARLPAIAIPIVQLFELAS